MKLFILDASGFLYRAYFALPELTNKNGQNINAIFGFYRMLLKIFQEKPDYLIIARDAGKKTFRHDLFEGYKANRPPIPDDFKRQIQTAKKIAEKIHLKSFEIDGYEADDIIGTIAESEIKENNNTEVEILSSDKDLRQLINEKVSIRDPMKNIIITKKDFIQEWGFEPKQFVDYLTLLGDSSDNIPGLNGVGKKTAKTLIQKYHSIENIYEHLNELGEKLKLKFIEKKIQINKSKELTQLATIENIKKIKFSDYELKPNFEELKKILVDEYNFHSLSPIIENLKSQFNQSSQSSLF